jgi:hypothetical protein
MGRIADETDHAHSSIQLLQMPWNLSSRQSSRQGSQDLFGRPQSRDSNKSIADGFRSSVSRGILDDLDFGVSSPDQGPRTQLGRASGLSPSTL